MRPDPHFEKPIIKKYFKYIAEAYSANVLSLLANGPLEQASRNSSKSPKNIYTSKTTCNKSHK